MKKSLSIALILLSCSLACPYGNASAAGQKDTSIDPGAEDYWNMMADKDAREAKKEAEQKDTTTQSGSSTSTEDRVKHSPSYSVPLHNMKGSYAQGK